MPGRGGRPFYPSKVVLILPKPTSWILKKKAKKNLRKMGIDSEKIKMQIRKFRGERPPPPSPQKAKPLAARNLDLLKFGNKKYFPPFAAP